MKVRKIAALASIAVAGSAGAAMLMLGSAGSALAQPGPSTNCSPSSPAAGCITTAHVNVSTTLTITDNTPALDWGSLAAGQSNVKEPASISVLTNDANGYTVAAAVYGTSTLSTTATDVEGCYWGDSGGASTWAFAADLSVNGNSPGAGTQCGPGGYSWYTTDTKASASAAGGDNYTDQWSLSVPANQTPGDYYANIVYYLNGS